MRLRLDRCFALFAMAVIMVVGFQNCSAPKRFGSQGSNTQMSGHGEGYSGKTELFAYFDSRQPCSKFDRYGRPLPNFQIFYQLKAGSTIRAPHLVRKTCQDIDPLEIDPKEITASDSSSITYQGMTFGELTTNGDFDVVASSCPAGKSPIAGAVRKNIFVSAFDWTNLSNGAWFWHQGVIANLYGTIQSLPSYVISRNDPAALNGYERASQFHNLQPSTDYVFSFVARPGTVNGATVRATRGSIAPDYEGLAVDFNFQTGTASVRNNTGLPGATATMVPFGNGYLCTLYFRTTSMTAFTAPMEIGVGPMDAGYVARVGDSVIATAAQLEPVSEFCQ